MRLMILLSATTILVSMTNGVFGATLQGLELLPRQNLASVLERSLSAAITIALIHLRAPLYLIAGAGIVPALAQSVYYLWALRGLFKVATAPSISSMRFLVRAGLPFLAWAIVTTLYGQTDPIVLKMVADFHAVGWYALAFRLEGTTLFLPVAVTTALLPTLSRAFQESPEHQFVTLARRAMEIILLCGVPIGLAMVTIPDEIILLLHYPPTFNNAIPVLRLAGIGTLLYYVTQLLGTLVVASNQETRMFRTTVAASLVGIPLCFAFAWGGHRWFGNGAAGALLSDLVLEIILVVGYLKILPRGLFDGSILSRCARYALAALPMAAFLHWAAEFHPGLWAVIPAALVYTAGCFLLRAVSRADLALLRGVMSRKVGVDAPEAAGVGAA
jgi:O-antigen/teichoic acid export membrane protein